MLLCPLFLCSGLSVLFSGGYKYRKDGSDGNYFSADVRHPDSLCA